MVELQFFIVKICHRRIAASGIVAAGFHAQAHTAIAVFDVPAACWGIGKNHS